ncbi:LysR substrate-binding domain-containing protein [Comamonas sp. J-3]|uniref:LysR substrate-binding domain-containing protein n=1 Tax=Comamonas trifloxystrobinivorans TaxID=3350256 RepID=UPI00372CBBFD
MPQPLDLDLLRSFVAVVDSGSFSHAALRIGRSQSAVSMQIQKLEALIGKPLLERGGKRVTPNSAGTDLLVHARRLLRLSDEAWASVTRPHVSGKVRLGVPESYAVPLVSPILERFASHYPEVVVEFVCEPSFSLIDALARDLIDIAVVTHVMGQTSGVVRREPMVWIGSAAHAVWEKNPLPIALFQTPSVREYALKALTEADRPYRNTYSSTGLAGLVTVVQSGLAVAAIARCSVPPGLSILGAREGLPPLPDLELGILRNEAEASAAVMHMYEMLQAGMAGAGR